ncbi:MAG TPA: ATP-binding protein, partial [Stellaceae bacterium]
ENAPCGYLSTLPDGTIVKVNQTFLTWTGYRRDDLLAGKRFQDLLTVPGRIFHETHVAPLLRMQGYVNEIALDLLCADGDGAKRPLPVLVNTTQKKDAAGQPGLNRTTVFNATDRRRYERELLAARQKAEKATEELQRLNETLEERVRIEIAERMKAEEALRQAQKMEAVGQLTGGIAHDFNNLLAVITGYLELLERRLTRTDEAAQRAVRMALNGAERAAKLTHRLLAFSRRQPLAPTVLNANKLVAGMSEMLRRTLGERAALETVLAGGLWNCFTDANQLESAVLNLAINARHAMPNGGQLTIETANTHLDDGYCRLHAEVTPGQYVMVAVTDTGVGIPKDLLDKVFEPFFTTKETGEGTGLGLSMVYGFVKQSNGHINIYSEVGQGTTVKIYLPRLLGPTDDAPDETVRDDRALRADAETILLVEDDEDVRAYTEEALEELGYSVLTAADGPAALQVLSEHPGVDLFFTDVGLPGSLNGRQLAEEARARRPGLRVLFTTGYARNAIVHHGRLDPGVELITKPFTYTALAEKIRQVLDSGTRSS